MGAQGIAPIRRASCVVVLAKQQEQYAHPYIALGSLSKRSTEYFVPWFQELESKPMFFSVAHDASKAVQAGGLNFRSDYEFRKCWLLLIPFLSTGSRESNIIPCSR